MPYDVAVTCLCAPNITTPHTHLSTARWKEDRGFAGLFLSRKAAFGPSKQTAEIRPLFWGEGGQLETSPEKINLFNRFLQIGFVKNLFSPVEILQKIMFSLGKGLTHHAHARAHRCVNAAVAQLVYRLNGD